VIWAFTLLFIILAIVLVRLPTNNGDETIVGGCGSVHPDYIQECCNRWAEENNIVKIQCVGEWEIKDGECAWKCDTG